MFELWNSYVRAAQDAWAVNAVITMRLMRIGTGGALGQREAQRMVVEKALAAAEAQAAGAAAIMAGRDLHAAADKMSAVYRRKVRANRRRLGRR